MDFQTGLVWIRRDLRLYDHAALSVATQKCRNVLLVFVFERNILKELSDKDDQRVTFIMDSLKEIESLCQKHKSSIYVCFGNAAEEIPKLCTKFKINALFFNEDYSPYTVERDHKVLTSLWDKSIEVFTFKDMVIFSPNQVTKSDGTPYKVYTPYKNAWWNKFNSYGKEMPLYKVNLKRLYQWENSESVLKVNWYKKIGFNETTTFLPAGRKEALKRLQQFSKKIDQYDKMRDFPSADGTSSLSTYLRFGNISIREMMKLAISGRNQGHKSWANELIWREFYQMIAYHFPHIRGKCFRLTYEKIKWKGSAKEFKAWIEGRTGFPLVDAAMRCFKETGLMHNRLRMVVASFLCKTLLVDWKKGERYFARKLLDYDFASNNGGWQWASSTGCDAQPYFRIFNPTAQSKKFDPKGTFILRWVPELRSSKIKNIHGPSFEECMLTKYPLPIVDYKAKREEALSMYKKIK